MADYDVGYGKPPERHRFKSGSSGNLKGRPRGSKNLASLFAKLADQEITITENGHKRRITKGEAVILQMLTKALSGDLRASKEVVQLMLHAEAAQERHVTSRPDLEWSKTILKSFLKRASQVSGDDDGQ
jgi:hypothetical protein